MTPEQIKNIRKSLGLTQSELAEKLRLEPKSGRNTVRAWEMGKRQITGPSSLALEYLMSKKE